LDDRKHTPGLIFGNCEPHHEDRHVAPVPESRVAWEESFRPSSGTDRLGSGRASCRHITAEQKRTSLDEHKHHAGIIFEKESAWHRPVPGSRVAWKDSVPLDHGDKLGSGRASSRHRTSSQLHTSLDDQKHKPGLIFGKDTNYQQRSNETMGMHADKPGARQASPRSHVVFEQKMTPLEEQKHATNLIFGSNGDSRSDQNATAVAPAIVHSKRSEAPFVHFNTSKRSGALAPNSKRPTSTPASTQSRVRVARTSVDIEHSSVWDSALRKDQLVNELKLGGGRASCRNVTPRMVRSSLDLQRHSDVLSQEGSPRRHRTMSNIEQSLVASGRFTLDAESPRRQPSLSPDYFMNPVLQSDGSNVPIESSYDRWSRSSSPRSPKKLWS